MSDVYRIYPITTCRLRFDKGFLTYRNHYGEKIIIPAYTWLVKGGGEPFLVDTGCSAKEAGKLSDAFSGEDEDPIEDSLERMGISTSDIKIIVMTHMHIDHFLNARKFPNAKLIIQEEELKFIRNPHPVMSKSFNRDWYTGLKFEALNGDVQIFPGIELIFTPGHTPGCQSVSVTTDQGKVVITGFCTIDDNFSKEGDIISGIHTDIFRAYDSFARIREKADIILPSHSERSGRMLGIPVR